jgi:hypothetical protein
MLQMYISPLECEDKRRLTKASSNATRARTCCRGEKGKGEGEGEGEEKGEKKREKKREEGDGGGEKE